MSKISLKFRVCNSLDNIAEFGCCGSDEAVQGMVLLAVDAFSRIAVGARICMGADSEKEKTPLLISEIMEMMRAAGAPGLCSCL